ncbi:SSU ribosomal protein S18p, zinc-dependent [Mycoplasmopsis meleagridis]|uniref:Small ribosomal subunit protein bS18 n=1 Tax=Mycoplasmopsis meleagridis ATCC 25294 TaxID=1264554 RepID=A0A0F5H005_9BACT|nr:30S ribosomal protein S18 [Mycoplasmopsis meleagridis]KKB26614.1 SSU ribosomal protein S18 zinc-dependent [Mycoplasmopsis meleagridis ATCC 25294]OAD18485.1 SSU ribosomal protein S18p, zinc-dependent [Mycoplasmopsis meleagridis]VEU77646.1 30S ribosomal protein [Mycoplasmopsis meleagridis]
MVKRNNKKNGFIKRRKCELCENAINYVDYKNVEFLAKFVNGTGQIKVRALTGTCSKHQRQISNSIKRARFIALMPYAKDRVRVMKSQQAQQRQQ